MAVAVAVIGKENYPLYIKTVSPGNDLKFLYTIHTSLDVIEEKVSSTNKSAGDLRELYLGLLYPTEDYKVYGYVTNTKIKFVVVVESSHTTLRDNEIRQMFRKIHAAYTDMVCNPFYIPGETITSKLFRVMDYWTLDASFWSFIKKNGLSSLDALLTSPKENYTLSFSRIHSK